MNQERSEQELLKERLDRFRAENATAKPTEASDSSPKAKAWARPPWEQAKPSGPQQVTPTRNVTASTARKRFAVTKPHSLMWQLGNWVGHNELIALGVGLLLVLVMFLMIASFISSGPKTQTPSGIMAIATDAELLIARCGAPSKDDSTAYDNPRPPIPSRIIEYKSQNVRFMFIPGGDAKFGDAPPYRWKLIGITVAKDWVSDPSEVKVLSVGDALAAMPCLAGK